MNRKTLLLLLVALVLTAGGLYATDSRMTALGYPYGFIRDNTDVHAYPATIFKYNRTLNGELADYDDYYWSIGTNVPLKANVLGVYFNLPTNVDADTHLFWDEDYDKSTDLDISKKVQFYLGFMDKFAVGFGMGIDSESTTDDDYKEEMGAHYYELSGGMSTDMMDLGLKLFLTGGKWDDNDTSPSVSETSYSGIGLNLGGRYFIQENGSLDIVGLANLGYESYGDEVVHPDTKAITNKLDHSGLLFELGAGANYMLGSNHNIVMTIKPIRYMSWSGKASSSASTVEITDTYTDLFVPEYTIGLESYITKWLTGRVGARQQYDFYKHTNEEGTYNYEYGEYDSSFDMNLGLAFKFGKFTIDTVLEKYLIFNGPDFIGGYGDGLASQVSVNFTY